MRPCGDLPFLHAGRTVRFLIKDPAVQRMRLQLQILRQPSGKRSAPGNADAPGDLRNHHRILPQKLYRGPVSVFGGLLLPGRDHEAADRNGDAAAHRISLPRLYPPEGNSRLRSGMARSGGPVCGSHERKHRASLFGRAENAGSPENEGIDFAAHEAPGGPLGAGAPAEREVKNSAGGANDPDDRRRHPRPGRRDLTAERGIIPPVCHEESLLFRLRAGGKSVAVAYESPGSYPGKPTLSGRLAFAVLRLYGRGTAGTGTKF